MKYFSKYNQLFIPPCSAISHLVACFKWFKQITSVAGMLIAVKCRVIQHTTFLSAAVFESSKSRRYFAPVALLDTDFCPLDWNQHSAMHRKILFNCFAVQHLRVKRAQSNHVWVFVAPAWLGLKYKAGICNVTWVLNEYFD